MEFHWKIVGVNGISWEYGNITVIISWRVVRVVQDLLILFWNDSPGLKLMCHNETQGTTGLTIFGIDLRIFALRFWPIRKSWLLGCAKSWCEEVGLQVTVSGRVSAWFSQPWRGQPPQFTKAFPSICRYILTYYRYFYPDESKYGFVWKSGPAIPMDYMDYQYVSS